MKICSICGVEKDDGEFQKRSKQCRECLSERKRKWNLDNRERKANKSKEWYSKNREKTLKNMREYGSIHRDNQNTYRRNRKATDPMYRLRCNLSSLIGKTIKERGFSKSTKTALLLDCSYQQLIDYIGPRPNGNYHLDHICPCSQATTEEELLKLQHHTNLRWLPASDNLSKSDSWSEEGEEMCRKLLGREWLEEQKRGSGSRSSCQLDCFIVLFTESYNSRSCQPADEVAGRCVV